MATTTIEPEEELLIISDDGEENIDMEVKIEQEEAAGDDIISFADEVVIEEVKEVKEEKESDSSKLGDLSLDSSSELNLDFDLGGDDSEMTVEKMLGKKEEAGEILEIESEGVEDAPMNIGDDDIFNFDIEDESEKSEALEKEPASIELEEVKKSDETMSLDVGFDIKEEPKATVKNEKIEAVAEEKEELLSEDVLLDDSLSMEDVLVEKKEEKVKVEEDIIFNKDLEEGKDEKTIEIASDKVSSGGDDGGDVNAILDATIAKLIKRKEQIEEVKEDTIVSIAQLNEEIKGLQGEVRAHKKEARNCDKETKIITENVASLEKMKMS